MFLKDLSLVTTDSKILYGIYEEFVKLNNNLEKLISLSEPKQGCDQAAPVEKSKKPTKGEK